MTPLTEDQVRELLALEAKATPGPWTSQWTDEDEMVQEILDPIRIRVAEIDCYCDEPGTDGVVYDAAFIAAARNAIRPLGEEVLALRAENRQLQADKAEMVVRNKLLRDRPDLPMERLESYERIETELLALRAQVPTWQPIETAPRDGTRVLLFVPGDASAIIGLFLPRAQRWIDVDYSADHGSVEPTHWMPLPKPPRDMP